MPRPTKRSKSVILVFCEGESEQVYTDFLKKEFGDVAAIRRPASTFGSFDARDASAVSHGVCRRSRRNA